MFDNDVYNEQYDSGNDPHNYDYMIMQNRYQPVRKLGSNFEFQVKQLEEHGKDDGGWSEIEKALDMANQMDRQQSQRIIQES